MAAMTTALALSGYNGDTILYALADHTAQKPSLVLVTRKAGNGPTGNIESVFQIAKGTNDVDGALVQSRAVVELRVKYPKHGTGTDVTAGLAIAQDVITSDEFLDLIQKQLPPA
jgi:hypothetical protein